MTLAPETIRNAKATAAAVKCMQLSDSFYRLAGLLDGDTDIRIAARAAGFSEEFYERLRGVLWD